MLRDTIKESFEKRFTLLLEEEYEEFIETILKPQRKSFRINTYKVNDSKVFIENLKQRGLEVEQVVWDTNSYFVNLEKEDARTDLGNLFEHFMGQIYIQEATSLLPPLVAQIPQEVNEDFKVLDMCSAPGSKTTQVAAMMKNRGVLVANELDYSRLAPLKLNLDRSGFTNIIITNQDGMRIQGEEEFDRIILDAPCSGSGVIRKSPRTLKTYNPAQLHQITSIQRKLFTRAVELLKKDGILVYSTCSIDPEENELMVHWALKEFEGAIELEEIKLEGVDKKKVVTNFQGIEIGSEIQQKVLRIWPHHYDTNGFFVSVFKKIS
ncbi:MAG: RsmB/NOP family class I SAM-dependent RNA methyltransferase [Nanoarchaeota archaeon]|nr:RsmB/NOP family class I SAM-dependent RNA methyltransferase [Nanoarchaeota archaeon]